MLWKLNHFLSRQVIDVSAGFILAKLIVPALEEVERFVHCKLNTRKEYSPIVPDSKSKEKSLKKVKNLVVLLSKMGRYEPFNKSEEKSWAELNVSMEPLMESFSSLVEQWVTNEPQGAIQHTIFVKPDEVKAALKCFTEYCQGNMLKIQSAMPEQISSLMTFAKGDLLFVASGKYHPAD